MSSLGFRCPTGIFVAALSAAAGCAAPAPSAPGDATSKDAAPGTPDADPTAPDANPNIPDANPTTPDANPNIPDANPTTPDAPVASADAAVAECTEGGNECGTGRACLAGICRDECLLGVWCDNAESGGQCRDGLCVQCQADSDCPGTRYRCDTSTYTCVDKPFDATRVKIGIFYHTWHCISNQNIYDLSEILAGNANYGPYYSSHYWDMPAGGYYCLSENDAKLREHAEALRDMGVDFVFVDATNHAYNSNALNDRPVEMIIQPFTRMVDVWSQVPNAPRIVPWVPIVVSDGSHPDNVHMIYTLLDLLNTRPGLQFEYEGKPLIMITDHSGYPVDEGKVNALSANYTLRRMWANEQEGTSRWSYMQRCQQSPLEPQLCRQRAAVLNGQPEQLPIATAYQADYMSHANTATPKHQGKTFRKQFETLFDNPEIPIATITGWNEWTVGRLPCDQHELCYCSNPQDANGCFLDQYDLEFSRDIEPAANAMGDYYQRLATACIALFRAGGRCDAAHANNLCCKDYTP